MSQSRPFSLLKVGDETRILLGIDRANFEALSVSLMAFIRLAALATNRPTAHCHSGVLPMQKKKKILWWIYSHSLYISALYMAYSAAC